jgi:hypothetical protein
MLGLLCSHGITPTTLNSREIAPWDEPGQDGSAWYQKISREERADKKLKRED